MNDEELEQMRLELDERRAKQLANIRRKRLPMFVMAKILQYSLVVIVPVFCLRTECGKTMAGVFNVTLYLWYGIVLVFCVMLGIDMMKSWLGSARFLSRYRT